jgi:VWFA-related protein
MKVQGFWSTALWAVVAVGLSAQAPGPSQAPRSQPAAQTPPPGVVVPPPQPTPTFRVSVDAVTQDVIVRDDRGQFMPDIKKDEFEVYEDGVKQEIISMTMIHGGRATNLLEAPALPPPEGIILPPVRRVNDTSGRIFLFFVDDLHLQFQASARVRDLFKKISKTLLHDGDLFGIVSSGPSSIAIDMTYDRKRMDQAIEKITGDGLKPTEIIQGPSGAGGPSEIRHRAHVAFSTMEEALDNLDKVHNRRKALVWVSEGYDFIPFQNSRLGLGDSRTGLLQNNAAQIENQCNNQSSDSSGGAPCNPGNDPSVMQQQQSEEFADADLVQDLAEITRAANRSNVTIYTIDPRGLVAGSDIDEPVDPREWNDYIMKSQNTLRTLADETGGLAVVNQNDFGKALARIDNETSDYYVLGYYSSNPDPTKRRRSIEVKVLRKGANITSSRKEYVMKALPPPTVTPPADKAKPAPTPSKPPARK